MSCLSGELAVGSINWIMQKGEPSISREVAILIFISEISRFLKCWVFNSALKINIQWSNANTYPLRDTPHGSQEFATSGERFSTTEFV